MLNLVYVVGVPNFIFVLMHVGSKFYICPFACGTLKFLLIIVFVAMIWGSAPKMRRSSLGLSVLLLMHRFVLLYLVVF